MSAYPRFSIIIPTFNRAELIRETVDSISQQTYENWECIVVDDASTDNTRAIIEEFSKVDPRIKYVQVVKSETVINDHVIIGSNCTIGGIGFGYEMNENGQYEQVPHIGNVVIGEKVEIGNNVCIDRAVMGSTTLDRSVKVDNLVHIAHGVHIQENSLIIAHAMIAGSVVVGKNSWIAPSASLKQKIKIGDNAVIGIGSVVLKDVEEGETVAGVPAKKIKDKD